MQCRTKCAALHMLPFIARKRFFHYSFLRWVTLNTNVFRKNWFLALDHINTILKQYPHTPDVANLTDAEIALIENKIMKTRACLEKYKHKIPVINELITLRNEIAHTKDDDLQNTQSVFNQAFPILRKIKTELEERIGTTYSSNKEKRTFEKFGTSSLGTESERKQIVDATENLFEEHGREDIIEFPSNDFSNAIKDVATQITQSDFDYLQNHPELSQNIQTEILDSSSKLANSFLTKNPFLQEEAFIEQLKKLSASELLSSLSTVQAHYKALPTNDTTIDFDFYQNQAQKLETQEAEEKSKAPLENKLPEAEKEPNVTLTQQKIQHDKEIYARNLVSDMEKSLQARKASRHMQKIDKWRKKLLQDLYKRIENFKKLEKLLTPFCKETGYLWNLSASPFKDCGFDVLKQYADLLEQDESLQELAKLLGKQNKESEEYEKELRSKIVVKTEYIPEPAYKGEICGITLGNDISSVLPSELALFKNPLTKPLFKLKFAQKQLLCFDYITNVAHQINKTETEEVSVTKENEKGPIILCIDTSGSMHGAPERIAKTLTFAITKIARSQNRKCFLISFSTQIQTLDLSGEQLRTIENLVRFLRMSFNGGTDTTPALHKSLEMLKTANYKNADVLMVSDFVADNLDKETIDKIRDAQKDKTNFYSLVIGDSGNTDVIEYFNENWSYDVTAKDSMKKLVRQLKDTIQKTS